MGPERDAPDRREAIEERDAKRPRSRELAWKALPATLQDTELPARIEVFRGSN